MDVLKKLIALFLIVIVIMMIANPALGLYISFKALELAIAWGLINGICKLVTGKKVLELFG